MVPNIVNNDNTEINNILGKCSIGQWNAPEGALDDDAEIVIDMKCPIKMKELELINGGGDFSTNRFSLFGSHNSTGPWSWLFTGEIDEGRDEVRSFSFSSFKLYHALSTGRIV